VNHHAVSPQIEVDAALRERLTSLIRDGWEIWDRFDSEVRQHRWHPFVAADYESVLRTLLALRGSGRRFLEWGSATGIITIMADLVGFEAYGIELDADLVGIARRLAAKHGSRARFAIGSFVPPGYRWESSSGDGRMGTIGEGVSGYLELEHPLKDFDLVYGYPWDGEEPMMHDLMRQHGDAEARLLLHGGRHGVRVFRGGGRER
jgi:hypothetical protein